MGTRLTAHMNVGGWDIQPYSVFIRTILVATTYGSDYGGGGERDKGVFQKMSQRPRTMGFGLQGGCEIEMFRGKASRYEIGSSHTLPIIGSPPGWMGSWFEFGPGTAHVREAVGLASVSKAGGCDKPLLDYHAGEYASPQNRA